MQESATEQEVEFYTNSADMPALFDLMPAGATNRLRQRAQAFSRLPMLILAVLSGKDLYTIELLMYTLSPMEVAKYLCTNDLV